MSSKKRGIDAYRETLKQKSGPQEGFVKKTNSQSKYQTFSELYGDDSRMKQDKEGGYKKAAHFLMLIGKEEASNVLKHMQAEEIEKIAREIAATKQMGPEETARTLMEFGLKAEQGVGFQGGIETARSMLTAAFGEEKGNELLKKAVPKEKLRPFQFLEEYEVEQISLLLKNESDYVIGIILAHLDPSKASKLLESLPPDKLKPVVRKIATMRKIDYEVIERMEQSLKNKIRSQGKVTTEEIDGVSTLTTILKHMGTSDGVEILKNLEEIDPSLSQTVKEKLFSFEDIARLRPTDLQTVLREFDEREIALILKGKPEETRQLVLENVSERRRVIIEDEAQGLGPRKKDEVEAAVRDFLHYIRTMIEEGTIVLSDEEWR